MSDSPPPPPSDPIASSLLSELEKLMLRKFEVKGELDRIIARELELRASVKEHQERTLRLAATSEAVAATTLSGAPLEQPASERSPEEEQAKQRDILENAMHRSGGKEAVKYLDSLEGEAKVKFLSAAMMVAHVFVTDAQGAPFAVRIIDRASQDDLRVFYNKINVDDRFTTICGTPHGSRCFQQFLDAITDDALAADAVALVKKHVGFLVDDANGCHIVSRMVGNRFQAADKDALFIELTERAVTIAQSRHGCSIMQRCLDVAPTQHKEALVSKLVANILELVQHPFGNYIVQYILDKKDESMTKRFIQQLLHNVAALSCNKFGSNVVERCLRTAQEDVRQLLIDELTDPMVLPRLLNDSFANYVLQTAIMSASIEQFKQIHNAVKPVAPALRNSPYGAKLQARINRRLRDHAKAQHIAAMKEKGIVPKKGKLRQQQQQHNMQQQQQQQQQQQKRSQSNPSGPRSQSAHKEHRHNNHNNSNKQHQPHQQALPTTGGDASAQQHLAMLQHQQQLFQQQQQQQQHQDPAMFNPQHHQFAAASLLFGTNNGVPVQQQQQQQQQISANPPLPSNQYAAMAQWGTM